MSVRLLYLVSHPIQYQAPMLRRIAQEPGIALQVLFERDTSDGYHDPGFGQRIRWDGDTPLRQGYDNRVASTGDVFTAVRDCDVLWLHGWQGPFFWQALAYAGLMGKPVLMRGENTLGAMPDGAGLRGWAKRRYLNAVFSCCSRFMAIGSDNKDYYLAHGIAPDRIDWMPYAVDNGMFSAAAQAGRPNRRHLRHALGIAQDRRVILFAGKLTPRKRPDLLLEAWKNAPWSGPRPALLFVGDGELGPQLQANGEDGVHFTGFINQSSLPEYYDLADIFVLPSVREPWGLAVNEAMACGTTVVVSDQVGAARDLIDGDNGIIVPADDAASLGDAMVRLLARSDAAGARAQSTVMTWGFEEDVQGLREALRQLGLPS